MRWLVRGLLLLSLAFANLNDIWSPDVVPNALFAWTVLRQGNVDYDEFTGPSGSGLLDREAYFFRACGRSTATEQPKAVRSVGGPPAAGPNDHVCSVFPPGMAIVALPFFAPVVLSGASPVDVALLVRVGHLVAAVVETIAALLLWSVFRRFTTARWSLALVLLYVLATSVRTVAAQALWQHAGVHLALAVALWLVLEERLISLRRELLAGLALGLGGVVRQTTVIASAGLVLGRPRASLAVAAGTVVGLLPLLAYDAIAFGDALEHGYGTKPFDTPLWTGLYGLLLSPSRGMLVYMPYLVAALVALVLAWRRAGHVARRLRGLSLAWLATLLLYATYAEWWGGRVFGARFLDDLAPVLFAALAWGIGSGLLARPPSRALFWIGAAWSLLLFQVAAFVYDQRWDTEPVNVNFAPARLLDWADPQWLSVLGDVPRYGARVVAAAALTLLIVALLIRIETKTVRPST
ncbi:MAG: hypothetical protein HY071_05020 [Chloroflexi bacterium]|nr:hypothetical protein [Chloroflexota bacterium]